MEMEEEVIDITFFFILRTLNYVGREGTPESGGKPVRNYTERTNVEVRPPWNDQG